MRPPLPPPRRAAFTLLELVTAVLIVAILLVLSVQAYSTVLPRVDRIRCTANLRSLHVAASLYVQEHRTWPQIGIKKEQDQTQYASYWITALRPYGATPKTWACPTTQRRSQSPDLELAQNARIDYLPNPFARGPQVPFRWARQPWFIERFDEHMDGNLVMFPDGHVESANQLLPKAKKR